MTRDILTLVEETDRQEFCTVAELFKALEPSQSDPFTVLVKLLDLGLLFRRQSPGYLGYFAAIHPSDVKCAIIKAKRSGTIVLADNRVLLNWQTPSECAEPLHALYIERANYVEVCEKIRLYEPPWPSDDLHALARIKSKLPRTSSATKAKISIKAVRLRDLRDFSERIKKRLERSSQTSYNWDLRRLPLTKRDFCRVVKRLYPHLEDTSDRTICNDLGAIGIAFQRGTRPKRNQHFGTMVP